MQQRGSIGLLRKRNRGVIYFYMNRERKDFNNIPFRYSEANIPWNEKEKIRHEVDTNYGKYEGLPFIAHRSLGLDNRYYIYFIENRGYDDINIFMVMEDADE